MSEPNLLETMVKDMAIAIAETRAEMKELHVAMVGTPDGSKTGLAQHLKNVMEDLAELSKRIIEQERTAREMQTKFVKYESFFSGSKVTFVGIGVFFGWVLEHFASKIFKGMP